MQSRFLHFFLALLFFSAVLTSSLLAQNPLASPEIRSALAALNKFRGEAGLDTVAISPTISAGCFKHAKYLVLNAGSPHIEDLKAHTENPDLPGYTKEGAAAAQNSVIHFVRPSRAIEGWIITFYHRIPLMQPDLRQIGIGYYKRGESICTLVDCISGLAGEPDREFVLYPNAGQEDVPLRMGPETPYPVNEKGDHGFPITIFFARWQSITAVTFKLLDARNRLVPCFVSTPEFPATDFDQWNTVCGIPKSPLLPNAQYRVSLSCKVNGKAFTKSYSFRTNHS